jgi:hypothetical protein
LTFQSDAAREVGLGIHVDEENALFGQSQRGGEIDGRGGLADAPFLIGDGSDAR